MSVLSDLGASNSAIQTKTITSINGIYYLTDYRQDSDGTVSGHNDYLPAFNRIQALISDYTLGITIRVPAGDYWLSDTLHLYKNVHIEGAGMGNHGAITRLYWPKDKTGIRCWAGNETNTALNDAAYGPYPGPAGFQGHEYGKISDMGIFCTDSSTASGHGIHISGQTRLYRLNIQGFGGDGVRIFAYNAGQGGNNAGTGMSNCWYIHDCIIRSNKGNGLFVQGADTNAGVAHMILGGNNTLWDFVDNSYLGNTYIGCQSDGGGLGSFKGASIYIGCYNESKATHLDGAFLVGGVLGPTFQSPTLIIEGDGDGNVGAVVTDIDGNGAVTRILPITYGSGYTTATVTPIKQGGGSGLAVTPNIVGGRITSYTITNGGSGYSPGRKAVGKISGYSGGEAVNGPLAITNYSKQSDRYLEAYICNGGNAILSSALYYNENIHTDNLVLDWKNTLEAYELSVGGLGGQDYGSAFRVISTINTTATMGRSAPITWGSIQFPKGFWLGGTTGVTGGRQMTNGTAAPSSGEWARGDIVWNTAPSAGGTPGWVCTTGGTPGTWKEMANLAA